MDKKKDKYIRFADMWFLIDATSGSYFYSRLSKLGLLKGQPKMLRFLGENDGCRQKDIAERFYLRAASVSGILNTMEKSGLIERKINPKSRRETLVYLTEKGKEKLEQVREFYGRLDDEVFAEFSDEEYETMMATLSKLQKAISGKI